MKIFNYNIISFNIFKDWYIIYHHHWYPQLSFKIFITLPFEFQQGILLEWLDSRTAICQDKAVVPFCTLLIQLDVKRDFYCDFIRIIGKPINSIYGFKLENYFHCENLQFKVINNMFHFRFLPQFKKTETYYDN